MVDPYIKQKPLGERNIHQAKKKVFFYNNLYYICSTNYSKKNTLFFAWCTSQWYFYWGLLFNLVSFYLSYMSPFTISDVASRSIVAPNCSHTLQHSRSNTGSPASIVRERRPTRERRTLALGRNCFHIHITDAAEVSGELRVGGGEWQVWVGDEGWGGWRVASRGGNIDWGRIRVGLS